MTLNDAAESPPIAVVVLRRTERHETEVLLRSTTPAADTSWGLLRGAAASGERESNAALRALSEAIGLAPERFYGAATPLVFRDGAVLRSSLFVAYLADAGMPLLPDGAEFAWCPLARAETRLSQQGDREAVRRVLESFVARAPDEALRIF